MYPASMTKVMTERDRLRQILIKIQRLGDCPSDLRDLKRMRKAVSRMIVMPISVNLRLTGKPQQISAVKDTVAIAHKNAPVRLHTFCALVDC